METDLARCLAEQAKCLDYLAGDGPDKIGAQKGLDDWIAEEVFIRLEMNRVGLSGVAEAHWTAVEKAMERDEC
jgi:hypothetical protein